MLIKIIGWVWTNRVICKWNGCSCLGEPWLIREVLFKLELVELEGLTDWLASPSIVFLQGKIRDNTALVPDVFLPEDP